MKLKKKLTAVLTIITVMTLAGADVCAAAATADNTAGSASGSAVSAGAAETSASASDTSASGDEYAAERSNNANSWRYKDGEPIDAEDQDTDASGSAGKSSKQKSAAKGSQAPNAASLGEDSSSFDITRKGIDVSEFQGNIDWEKVKASGVEFAIIRCGYGMNQTDQDDAKFLRNITECERLDIPYGVYLYSYATNTTRAQSEAEHVLRLIEGHDLSYPVYFDMEDSSTLSYRSSFGAIASAFCSKITAAGYSVGVYANLYWWNTYLTDSAFDSWHKWVAQFNSTCQYSKTFAMWQYSETGTVSGISGNVDMDYLIGYPEDHGSPETEINGVYSLRNSTGTSYAAAQENGYVKLSAYENYIEQKFRIEHISGGYHKITDMSSGKVLGAASGAASVSGTVLGTYEWTGSNAQLWKIKQTSDGYYTLSSRSGLYIDISSASASAGSSLCQNKYSGKAGQKWTLEEETLVYDEAADTDADANISRLFGSDTTVRYAGNDRYETAIMAADAMKKSLGISRFENIIIACGSDYPDALSGAGLAAVKNAPILLISDSCKDEIEKYINENLRSGGTVYLLGGEGVISADTENDLKEIADVKRLAGSDRYGTNMAVLEEIGNSAAADNSSDSDDAASSGGALLVCSATSFADSLSASAAGLPILLTDSSMTEEQKNYIEEQQPEKIYLIGGTGVVSSSVEKACRAECSTVRIAGKTRYTTSTAAARAFFGDESSCAVLAYAQNFPDGLAAGPLAMSLGSPVILTDNSGYGAAVFYSTDTGTQKAAVLGGQTLIDSSVMNKFIN